MPSLLGWYTSFVPISPWFAGVNISIRPLCSRIPVVVDCILSAFPACGLGELAFRGLTGAMTIHSCSQFRPGKAARRWTY